MGAQSRFGTAVFVKLGRSEAARRCSGVVERPFLDSIDDALANGITSSRAVASPPYGHSLPVRRGILPRKYWAKWLSQAPTSGLSWQCPQPPYHSKSAEHTK